MSNTEEKMKEMYIADLLKKIGMPAHIKGYMYVKYAIDLVSDKRELISYVTKKLYPMIAKKFTTTSARCERAIRHSIEVAFDRGNQELLEKLFGYSISSKRGKPTNSEFIAVLSEYVQFNFSKSESETSSKED